MFDILCSFKSNLFSNFTLLGDFNVDMLSHHSNLCKHITNILNSFSLTLVVKEPTHFSSVGSSSLIDLVIMSAPQFLHECVTVPPLANSDHLSISLQVKSNIQTHVGVNKRVIWRYAHADFNRACELIDMLDMDSIIDSNSVEKSWSNWKRTFMYIMEDCVPKAQFPNRRNLPWLTKEIVRTIKERNYYYRIARKHGRSGDYDKYKCLRNDVVSALKHGKAKKFNTLNPNLSKNFWTAIRYVKKK